MAEQYAFKVVPVSTTEGSIRRLNDTLETITQNVKDIADVSK